MKSQGIAVGLLLIVASSSTIDVSSVDQLETALNGDDSTVVLKDIHVPAGKTLKMENVKYGTVIKFTGKITFGYKEWVGPLLKITGTNVTVKGTAGNLIDGGGARWWDGKGGSGGKTKPKFITFHLIDSKVFGLNFKNSPVQLASVNVCYNVMFSNIRLDNSEGHAKGGQDTDGFDVDNSANLFIRGCHIENQGDCLAINSCRNINFQGNVCIGGHGISIGSAVDNFLVAQCTVINSTHGIRINAVNDRNIAIQNVELRNISKFGITTRGESIDNLAISNVHGTVDPRGANLDISVANSMNWFWYTNVTGGKKKDVCQGIPRGANIPCKKYLRGF